MFAHYVVPSPSLNTCSHKKFNFCSPSQEFSIQRSIAVVKVTLSSMHDTALEQVAVQSGCRSFYAQFKGETGKHMWSKAVSIQKGCLTQRSLYT